MKPLPKAGAQISPQPVAETPPGYQRSEADSSVLRDSARNMTDRILCFLPCGAEPEGSVDLEGILTVHSEVAAHVRDFSVLALLAWRADFDGDNATLRRLC